MKKTHVAAICGRYVLICVVRLLVVRKTLWHTCLVADRVQWHPLDEPQGVTGAELDGLIRLRILVPSRAIATDDEAFLAWVDAFRRTYTSSETYRTLNEAKLAALGRATEVLEEKQRMLAERLRDARARHDYAFVRLAEEDLGRLEPLLTLLDNEQDRLS